jgi:hypothetical protein
MNRSAYFDIQITIENFAFLIQQFILRTNDVLWITNTYHSGEVMPKVNDDDSPDGMRRLQWTCITDDRLFLISNHRVEPACRSDWHDF